jgi:hypothetical protein
VRVLGPSLGVVASVGPWFGEHLQGTAVSLPSVLTAVGMWRHLRGQAHIVLCPLPCCLPAQKSLVTIY